MKKINKFYVAYKWRGEASPKYIENYFSSYEEARAAADRYLCDDDDAAVWIRVHFHWYRIIKRDIMTDRFIVHPYSILFHRKIFLSNWY